MPTPQKSGKAFYILLCAILGALLFIVLQRAITLIYYLLLDTNFQSYSLGLDYIQLSWINFLTFLAAIFFGLWYGIWLGLHWYETVYDQGRGGLFHGFRFWRHTQEPKTSTVNSSEASTVTVKPAGSSSSAIIDKLQQDSWDLDDLMDQNPPPENSELSKTIKPKTRVTSKRKNGSKRNSLWPQESLLPLP